MKNEHKKLVSNLLISILFVTAAEGCYTQLMTTKQENENDVQYTDQQPAPPSVVDPIIIASPAPFPPPCPIVIHPIGPYPPPQAVQIKTDSKPAKSNIDRNFGSTRGGSTR